ncbi:MAG: tRNA (adenosine(37)-N6)-threonylcarbamoyltransferase complex transferase subunit TsaD [Dehalococcoidia bacterium]|nr:MAG: tRNA (adenosine(37)-N6)-threonylcarbamoyltransferase complex transferase subunit TsaD [Dehalococcoidia bacterium]
MKVLGIETSCDETAAAVIEDGVKIISSEIASQIELHARYGGIVPEVASRQHMVSIIPVISKAMNKAHIGWHELSCIAVTRGPGLAGSLLVGTSIAKSIAAVKQLPLIGINHLEAHIYANWLSNQKPEFPLLCLIVSGGHSDLVLMQDHGKYTVLGRTRDDAAGEAFDKAARILGLGYPGGPAIDRAATKGTVSIDLPYAWMKGTYDFSFSGLKTALFRLVEKDKIKNMADAAFSFQRVVVDILVSKTIAAAKLHRVKQVLLSGGVAANRRLRQQLKEDSPIPVLIPEPVLCTDNAAMVAACGYFCLQANTTHGFDMDVVPNLKLNQVNN